MTLLLQRIRTAGNRVRPATPSGLVTIQSLTIDSTGEELTVGLSGSATISDETGWSIAFDNYAERVLTYSSGSGSSSLVFAISANPTYTAEGTSNDAAPVGVTGTVSYSAATGNVTGLDSATDISFTNNSTAIPDPDLPETVDASLPANWNATADHSPANGTALQALFDDFGGTLNAGDVIELDADVDYGTITIPADVQGDASNWIIVRSDEYASLPAYGSRVVEADEQYMPTISKAPTAAVEPALYVQAGSGGQGASYIRFIGVKIAATGSGYAGTNYIGPLVAGTANDTTAFTDMPQGIGLDRCIITVDDDVNPWHCQFDVQQSFVVGCCFHNFWGGGNDGSNAIRTNNGSNILVHNNSFESMGAACFLGNNDDCDVIDFTYTRNYHLRPSAWNDSNHGTHKASYECKTGLRLLIAESVFDGQYNASFASVTLKAEGTGGPKTTKQVTVRGNKVINCEKSFLILVGGSSDVAGVGPNSDWLVIDNLSYGINTRALDMDVWDGSDEAPFERLKILNNTLIGTSRVMSVVDGTTPGTYHEYIDNVLYGTYGVNNGTPGAEAFNWGWNSTYTATHNLFSGVTYGIAYYDNDTSPTPLGTLTNNNFPATLAAYGFEDDANDDYRIADASSYAASSSTSGKPGYDSVTYDSIWSGVTP